jgi:uncharacterized protein (UPF0261 family)
LSQLDSDGKEFWWPEADAALLEAFRKDLRADIPVVALDANINDPQFADRVAQELLAMIKARATSGVPRNVSLSFPGNA